MRLTSLFYACLALASCQLGQTAPTNATDLSSLDAREPNVANLFALERRARGDDDPTTPDGYTQTFWDTVKRRNRPRRDKCLFYSSTRRGMRLSNTARAYAYQNDLDTIWDNFLCRFFDDSRAPRAGFLANQGDANRYFLLMSVAMARYCEGEVKVMVEKPSNIPQNGIWFRGEYPKLVTGGKVTKITAVDLNGASPRVIFENGQVVNGAAAPPPMPSVPQRRKVRALNADDVDMSVSPGANVVDALEKRAALLRRADDAVDPNAAAGEEDCNEEQDDPCVDVDCDEHARCFSGDVPAYDDLIDW